MKGFIPSAVAKSRTMIGGLIWMILTSPVATGSTAGAAGTETWAGAPAVGSGLGALNGAADRTIGGGAETSAGPLA
ncbi:MAG TPA: hypothetical protein PLF88_12600, partial [Opitutaceae bacterium]|nr:hypothetical protein [Opitutaceae bacterium]